MGSLRVTGGCPAKGCSTRWPSTNATCLDSACGNNQPGDCRNGPELYECMGACCTCNQMWKMVPAQTKGGGPSDTTMRTSRLVHVMNGEPGPLPDKPIPGCNRSQKCLAACT